MSHDSARLFVAVELPAGVRAELAAWARAAVRAKAAGRGESAPLRLIAPELLHLTLCFLGEQPHAGIEPIKAALATGVCPVSELSLGAPVWLPPRHPRALAVEIHDDSEDLQTLRDTVAEVLSEVCAYEPERRRFRPHVTVARMRPGAAPRDRTLQPTPALAFTPERVVLYRSRLVPAGASYEHLAGFALGV